MISAGDMDRQITIEKRTTTQSASGAETESWTTHATVWASKQDDQGDERTSDGVTSSITTTTWGIRWRSGLNSKDYRIKYNGLVYDITGQPVEVGRKEGLKIKTVLRQ